MRRPVENKAFAGRQAVAIGKSGQLSCQVCHFHLNLIGGMYWKGQFLDFYVCPLCGCEYEVKNNI